MRVTELLERNVRLYGDHTAVAVVGATQLSYRELNERILKLASGLASVGVMPGDRIALLADNGLPFFDVVLAAAYLGAAALPLGTRLTESELAFILEDATPTLGIIDERYADRLDAVAGPQMRTVAYGTREASDLYEGDGSGLGRIPSQTDTSLIIYTSGTTGNPKGVCLSQHALCFNAMTIAMAQGLRHSDVFLSTTPLYHAATATRIVTMLLDGQTHVVLPKWETETAMRAIDEYGVTTTIVVPTQLQWMLESRSLKTASLESLRLLVYGAAPTGLDIIRRAIAELPTDLFQGYGLTEGCPNLTGLGPEDHHAAVSDERLLSCGRPVPGVDIRICDEKGNESPSGEIGEIVVRTEKVMNGYWNRPEATAEVLIDGWLHTGDLAKQDAQGYITIVGRAKDMLISGGVNIYPVEIESVLEEMDGVAEAAVVGARDAQWGEVPIAFVVADAGRSLDTRLLQDSCRTSLAAYKVPKRIVVLAELPRTSATNKVAKGQLRDLSEQMFGVDE